MPHSLQKSTEVCLQGETLPTSIIYHGSINPVGARNLEVLLTDAVNRKKTNVTLHICSSGGDVTAGVGLANFLSMIPIVVNTHCFGRCGSIAVNVLLAGTVRSTEAIARFSLHAASYTEGPKKGQMADDTHLISEPFSQNLKWSRARLDKYFGSTEEKTFGPADAQRYGIVQEVVAYKMIQDEEIVHVAVR